MAISKSFLIGGVLAFARLAASVEVINNVHYCNEVDKIQYKNVGTSGVYKTPSMMNSDGGCSVEHTEKSYGGPLAPLNDQLSIFLRGPLELKQFAVYYLDNTPDPVKKREASISHKRHNHRFQHEKRRVKTEVVEEVVTVTQYAAPSSTSSSEGVNPTMAVENAIHPSTYGQKKKGAWKRTGYYNAADGVLDGLVFLNNKGGQDSGKWTTCFGNSLSYMSADGHSAAASSQILAAGSILGVNEEFSIWTNQTCDSSCGYSYASDPCYKGFDGVDKVFVFEFQMPTDTKNAGDIYGNSNMPAIWGLNSHIGRTQQYPAQKEWSCWSYGCGEFDMWEVLYWDYPASQYLTSTLHSAQGAAGNTGAGGGGICDYMKRPTDAPMKGMVSFLADGTITIQKLDDDFEFAERITNKAVRGCESSPSLAKFTVPS